MPELPEVETVRVTLEKLVVNKTIDNVEVAFEKIIKLPGVSEFEQLLKGQTLTNIRRTGKYLFFDFTNYTLISHLRMEGKYQYNPEIDMGGKHDLVYFNFTDGSQLVYNDTRRFGTMHLVDLGDEINHPSVSKLGPEPFDPEFDVKYFQEKTKKKAIAIKKVLLDQTIVTGLGNIYVDEVLFKSKIHPLVLVNKLTKKQIQSLIDNSIYILNLAIKAGGSTVKSYTITGDVHGKFQHALQVYGRKGEECFICHTPIEKIKVGGRGTHFCPNCQKI